MSEKQKKEEKIVKLKLDVIFKRIFGNENNKAIISKFISDLLEIPHNKIRNVYIKNVELTPKYLEKKFSRLDLKLDVDGKIINIEIQVNSQPDFRERTLFYWSSIFSNELKEKEEYKNLKETICINIINFNLFRSPVYHSHFKILEKDRLEVLSDKFAIHFFELRKIKKYKQNKPMEDWLNLINAEKEKDLMALETATNIPEVKDVIVKLRELSADEQVREEALAREIRLHDEASAINSSRKEGLRKGLEKGRREGLREGERKGRAEGRTEGRAEGINQMIEVMRLQGYSEEQIKRILGAVN